MNRDDIIRMAREAGLNFYVNDVTEKPYAIKLGHFAALVAAHEREKVARWMMERDYATGHGDTIQDLIKEVEWQVAELENEACAKLCELVAINACDKTAQELSFAIRARGEQ